MYVCATQLRLYAAVAVNYNNSKIFIAYIKQCSILHTPAITPYFHASVCMWGCYKNLQAENYAWPQNLSKK